MFAHVSPGEGGRLAVRRRPICFTVLKRAALVGVLWLGVVGGPAFAGALYRCVGSTGETVFSGSTAGYRDCKRIGSTGPSRPARSALGSPAPAQMVASSVKPSFEGVTASVAALSGGATPMPAMTPSTSSARASLDGVTASVVDAPGKATMAPALPPAAPVKRGWSYQESPSADLATGDVPAPAPGSRVLRGAVYRITHADGGVEYTNVPPGGAPKGQSIKMLFTYIATCVACDLHSKIDWNSVALNLGAYGDTIRAASVEYGVDEALLRAVIHAESAFNPRALSVAGAQGLMQLVPGTARDMGVLDAFDAEQNIRGGARYLALLLRNFNGNERLAAAAYNAGPKAVERYNGVPPYDETQVYVERVGILRRRYGESLRQRTAARALM